MGARWHRCAANWPSSSRFPNAHRVRRPQDCGAHAGTDGGISGQILLDFETARWVAGAVSRPKAGASRMREAEGWFQQGSTGRDRRPVEEAIEAYQKALNSTRRQPRAGQPRYHLYRQRKFADAETYYAKPSMPTKLPLAQFNIGNLYDELGRLDDARSITGWRWS